MSPSAPLNALRAFEAAARTGSFSGAARELGVSSAAVSQQVRLLEGHWSEALFIRQGNRIALTEAGQTAYPQVAQAMASLTALSDRMRRREPSRKRLTLSAPQSVAETWLVPALAGLDPDIVQALGVRVDADPVDLVAEKVDLRIFYGHDLYGDCHVVPLFSDVLVAVASPGFVARHGRRMEAVGDGAFIHTDWGRGFASSPDWGTALLGRRTVERNLGPLAQSSSMALHLARQGLGVALAPFRMAADDLAAGRLVRLDLPPSPLPWTYSAAVPKRHRANPAVVAAIEALRRPPSPGSDATG